MTIGQAYLIAADLAPVLHSARLLDSDGNVQMPNDVDWSSLANTIVGICAAHGIYLDKLLVARIVGILMLVQ